MLEYAHRKDDEINIWKQFVLKNYNYSRKFCAQ